MSILGPKKFCFKPSPTTSTSVLKMCGCCVVAVVVTESFWFANGFWTVLTIEILSAAAPFAGVVKLGCDSCTVFMSSQITVQM